VEYHLERWINQTMHHHHLMASVVVEFSTWGVTVFGVLAVGLWVLSPPGDTLWKRACAAGLSAAALGLLINVVIAHLWHRPRPYQAHHQIVPLVSPSFDPSFPSDHATAALSIAFGVVLVCRRAGWVFLPFGIAVAASRVLAGMHYPTDILGSAVISIAAAYFTARVAMERLLMPLIRLVSRLTDPLLARLAYLGAARRTVLSPAFRGWVVGIVCTAIFLRIGWAERPHIADELPGLVLAGWALLSIVSVKLASSRYWPAHGRARQA
jgi:undecaprenyl-diphosphatase